MKKLLILLSVALAAASCQKDMEAVVDTPVENDRTVQGEIRLKLSRDAADALRVAHTRSGFVTTGMLSFDELCERYSVTEMVRLFEDNGFPKRTRESGLDRWYTIRFEGTAGQIVKDFGTVPGVDHAEVPVRVERVYDMPQGGDTPVAAPQTRAVPANYPFNDPLFGGQWTLYNDGTIYSNRAQAGADVNVLPAWEKVTGRPDVIVAILDEGVQYDHPDLAANMWNGNEFSGKNFTRRSTTAIQWGQGHGTHVAGAVAAVSNNGIGISGTAGGTGNGDGVKMMTCQIFDPHYQSYDASTSNTGAAFKWACDNGAVICQNSWGYAASNATENEWARSDAAVKEGIDYFIKYAGMDDDNNQVGPMAGGVVIFAAGNDGSSYPGYPAAYTPCISVTAISCNYEPAYYTNYGTTVDISAPGGGAWVSSNTDIPYARGYNLSTLPTDLANGQTFEYHDAYGQDQSYRVNYVSTTVGYGYMMGTSMACPHVSGVAALVVSRYGTQGFTNTDLKKYLLETTRDIDSYIPASASAYRGKMGHLVDAGAAVSYGGDVEVPPIITPAEGQSDNVTVKGSEVKTLQYTLSNYTDWSVSDSKIETSQSGNVVTLTFDASKLSSGSHTVTLTATNGSLKAERKISYTVGNGGGGSTPSISVDLYPNPCTDYINVRTSVDGSGTLRIRNLSGIEVLKKTISLTANTATRVDDVKKLSVGTYSAEIEAGGHKVIQTIIKK